MAWPTAPGQIAAPLAGFCWRRHLELAHVKCSHPPQSLWPQVWSCTVLLGRLHPLKARKRIQKGPLLAKWPFPNVLGESESIIHVIDFK